MRILVLTPTERENRNMEAALERASSLKNDYTVVRCGIGKACAAASTARALCSSGRPFDMLAVIGYAASAEGRRQGEVVMPRRARYHDCIIPDGFIPEMTGEYALCGRDEDTVFTGDSFVGADMIRAIKSRFAQPRALFDMGDHGRMSDCRALRRCARRSGQDDIGRSRVGTQRTLLRRVRRYAFGFFDIRRPPSKRYRFNADDVGRVVDDRYMSETISGNSQWNGLDMPRRLWAIMAVAFGVSASVISGAIVNVALPTFSAEMSVSSADSVWAINSYQLAIVMTLLIFSNLGDIVGYRRIYISGLVLFTLASLGCALAGSFTMLILCRIVEGVGAAAVTSINTTIIRIIYPRDRLARGLGINATIVAVSSVAGPSLAAAILSVASWHWLSLPSTSLSASLLSYSAIGFCRRTRSGSSGGVWTGATAC